MSSLSKEELYGKIVAISKDHVEVILVCGTSVQVSVENLQQRKCTIRMDTTINEYLSDEFENDQKDTNNNQPETLSSRC
jgi:uncharacterized protein YlbG (UPF0298 family)